MPKRTVRRSMSAVSGWCLTTSTNTALPTAAADASTPRGDVWASQDDGPGTPCPACGFGRLDDPGNESLGLQGIRRAKTIRATVASKDGKTGR
jgi:hypothetical protein